MFLSGLGTMEVNIDSSEIAKQKYLVVIVLNVRITFEKRCAFLYFISQISSKACSPHSRFFPVNPLVVK